MPRAHGPRGELSTNEGFFPRGAAIVKKNQDSKRDDVLASEVIEERDDAVIGSAFRWSLTVMLGLVLIAVPTLLWMQRPKPQPPAHKTVLDTVQMRELPGAEVPDAKFTDVTNEAGIHFTHTNGASGEKLLPETMGGGGG